MRFPLAALVAASLALTACGGEGSDGGDEEQIREVVTAFYESEEGVCDSITDDLLDEQFESREDCQRAAAASEPEQDYEIGEVEVDGDEATAQIEVPGPPGKKAETGSLVLQKEDGEWKVDGIQQ